MESLTTVNRASDTAALAPAPNGLQRPDYALLFFDHLFSEYVALKHTITDQNTLALLDSLHQKRTNGELTWSDIYTFDLALIDQRPLEHLIRKAYDARARYRAIAGQKEFDEYLASKPPDLTTIIIASDNQPAPPGGVNAPPNPPAGLQQPADVIQRLLRADIRYLLSKFYLYYAMLPMREGLREYLTTRAVRMTKWILGIILLLIAISFGGSTLLRHFKVNGEFFDAISDLMGAFGPMIGSVALAGVIGGCISMLQRIQSAPSEGDALFNLAALTVGWRGLSLSPLYGGIFASVLFILFAAGLLKGAAFPAIETSLDSAQTQAAPAEKPKPPDQTKPTVPTSNVLFQTTALLEEPKKPDQTTTNPSTDQAKNRSEGTEKSNVLRIKDFLKGTGPKDGVSFALLMIWSFIAGFAERLVPDTLNRMVAKNQALQGVNS
ncbi:MAG TPA: hypothetical protein VGK82_12515 [Pyrinomonadaceae bacterium]